MSRRIRLAILTIGTIAWVPAILYTAGLFDSILVGAAVAIAGPALWWTIYIRSQSRQRHIFRTIPAQPEEQ